MYQDLLIEREAPPREAYWALLDPKTRRVICRAICSEAEAQMIKRRLEAFEPLLCALRKCSGWTERAAELEVSGSMMLAQQQAYSEALAVIAKAGGAS